MKNLKVLFVLLLISATGNAQSDKLVFTSGNAIGCFMVRAGTNFVFYRPDSAITSGEANVLINDLKNIYVSDYRRADLLIRQNKKLKSIIKSIRPVTGIQGQDSAAADSVIKIQKLAFNAIVAAPISKPKRIIVVDESDYQAGRLIKKGVRQMWFGVGLGLAVGVVGIIADKPLAYGLGAVLPLIGCVSFSINLSRAGDALQGTLRNHD